MKPLRDILPARSGPSSEPISDREEQEPPRTLSQPRRRPQTRIACSHCRRRKSKCDGRRPVCGICAAAGLQECQYDGDPDLTRAAALKRKYDRLHNRNELLEELFKLLSRRSDDECIEIMRRIRSSNLDTELEDLVRFIREGDLLVHLSAPSSEKNEKHELDMAAAHTSAVDETTSLLATLNAGVAKLDPSSRTSFLITLRNQIDEMASIENLETRETSDQTVPASSASSWGPSA